MNSLSNEIIIEKFKETVRFNYNLKKLNWFNIGGNTKIFFKPQNLEDLINFIKIYNEKIFIIGAGSNVLLSDNLYEGAIIKLSNSFSKITLFDQTTIIAGCGALDRSVSEFAMKNNIGGLEFLSGIPGTIGGGIRMNSGCFGAEFKDILISVQTINRQGQINIIPAKNINFNYRSCDLSNDLIFLSATFKGIYKEKNEINEKINEIKKNKRINQPSRIKTGGSTFKNPINKTKKKVWELINESISTNIKFGDAKISEKHLNFFVNSGNASFEDMKQLINFVKKKVKNKTGIDLELEIILVE